MNVGVRPTAVPPAELIFVLVFPLADYCWENGPAEWRNIACATAESCAGVSVVCSSAEPGNEILG